MKNLIFIVILLLGTSLVTAQDKSEDTRRISFGAKLGLNIASLNGDNAASFTFLSTFLSSSELNDLDPRVSANIGALANIPFSEWFAVQPEILYSGQGYEFKQVIFEENFSGEKSEVGRLDYIIVPILADFTVAEGFSLQTGPQVGFLINDTIEFETLGTYEIDAMAEGIDFSVVFGAQYRTAVGVFFQVRYALGLTDVDSTGESDAKNGVFSLSAGWFFN